MKIKQLDTVEIFRFFIEFLSTKLMPEHKLLRLIFVLIITAKGLTPNEIIEIVIYLILAYYLRIT